MLHRIKIRDRLRHNERRLTLGRAVSKVDQDGVVGAHAPLSAIVLREKG